MWHDFKVQKYPRKIRVGGGARPFETIKILFVSAVQCMPPRRAGQWLRYGALSVTYVTSLPGHMYPAYVPFIFVKMLIENVKKNNANNSNLLLLVDLKYIPSLCWHNQRNFWSCSIEVLKKLWEKCLVLFFNSLGLFLIPINQYIYIRLLFKSLYVGVKLPSSFLNVSCVRRRCN